MNEKIFRKKSMDKITSPEQLDAYIRVTNPGVWMLLSGMIIILLGICVWGIFGKLDTKITVPAVSQNGTTICYIKEDDIEKVTEEMPVEIDGKKCTVSEISQTPVTVDDQNFEEYAMHIGSFSNGEWVYMVKLSDSLPDGIYKADIIVESVSPMSFIIN